MASPKAIAAILLLLQLGNTLACSIVAIGKDVSSSGHPMISHTEDMGVGSFDIRLVRVPHQTWPKGSMRPLYNWQQPYPRVVSSAFGPEYAPVHDQKENEPMGYIPQVEETFGYWDTDYGVQNEEGLSIGESTCTAMTVGFPVGQPGGFNRVGIEDLTKVAMERCATSRCAVETMGKLAVEEGFYSADSGTIDDPDLMDSAESLILADPSEIWIFHVLTGKNNASAIWAAQRVPPDHIAVLANAFTIGKMNLSDPANFLYSPGVTELAREKGWWSPEEEVSPDIFDFFGAYGHTAPDQASRRVDRYYSGRRMWRIYSKFSPVEGGKLDPNLGHLPKFQNGYPATMPAPKGSVSLKMMMDILRDHYEGTPYDLTQGIAAGPYGNPNRFPVQRGVTGFWERAISMYRAVLSFVLEAKPNRRSVTWFGWDAPHGTAYLPFFAGATYQAPPSYCSHDAHMSKFSPDAAWWAFNLVNQYADNTNFRAINAEVRAKADQVEIQAIRLVAEWGAEADKLGSSTAALLHLGYASNSFAEQTVKEWWELAWHLIGKYRGGTVNYNESYSALENSTLCPEKWLQSPEVGYKTWTSHGPFHGVSLDEQFQCESQQLSIPLGTSGFVMPPVAVITNMGMSALMAAVVGALAYQAGVKKGRASFDVQSCYVAYP